MGVMAMEVVDLRCEYRADPLGIESPHPRLGWRLAAPGGPRAQVQTAYRILVASSPERLRADQGDVWDSGRVASAQSFLVPFAGSALGAVGRYHWKVQVWDGRQAVSPWSAPAQWTMGLPTRSDWTAQWIGLGGSTADAWDHLWFRKRFSLPSAPVRAIAFVSSLGYHELYANGARAGDQVLAPNVSYLPKRALYVAYDVTALLRAGDNALGLWLGPGWINFQVGGKAFLNPGVSGPLGIVQLHVEWADGSQRIIASDGTWKGRVSCSRHIGRWENENKGGDRYDAARDLPGWSTAELDDAAWTDAAVRPMDLALSADLAEPNRVIERLQPRRITPLGDGAYRMDMGRNFAGWLEMPLTGAPGRTVRVCVSDDPKTKVRATYQQISEHVLGPDGTGVFRNRFSYSAGRWITVEGLSAAPRVEDVVGLVVANDRRRIGGFTSSNALFNRIHGVTVDTYQALTLGGMSADCPHRERKGYGGDAHTTLDFALANWESGAFFTKWLRDWRDVQRADGSVPHTAPTVVGGGGPGWSGFPIVAAWEMHLACGDRRVLEETYPAIVTWLDFLAGKRVEDGLLSVWGDKWTFLGDWMPPGDIGEWSDSPGARLFNNCYYAHILDLAARIARALDRPADASDYERHAAAIRTAIHRVFSIPGRNLYLDARQSHILMPLIAGAVPAELIPAVQANLVRAIVDDRKGHLDTGMHASYFLARHLTDQRRGDLMALMLNQRDFPGYGHLIERHQVTTWPEGWDGRGSRIHHTLPGMTSWFQQGLAGIRPDPRYAGSGRMLIAPAFIDGADTVAAHTHSPHGRVACAWRRLTGGGLAVAIDVPVNAVATVELPVRATAVTEDGKALEHVAGVSGVTADGFLTRFAVGSGHYAFAIATGDGASNGAPTP